MNNFKHIFNEYKDSFLNENGSVLKNSLKPVYCIIKNGNIETSDLPFIMDSAEEAFVICRYKYIVITQQDTDFFFLYMNNEGIIDNAIVKDGWILKFKDPQTGPYRSRPYFSISKQNLYTEIDINGYELDVPRMWKLFSEARECTTQLELKFLEKLFDQEAKLEDVTKENAILKYRESLLEERIASYKELLKKIEDLVDIVNKKF